MGSYSNDYGTNEIHLLLVISSKFWSPTELAWVSFKSFLLKFLCSGIGATWGCSVQNSWYLNQASPSCFKFEVRIAGNILVRWFPLSFLCILLPMLALFLFCRQKTYLGILRLLKRVGSTITQSVVIAWLTLLPFVINFGRSVKDKISFFLWPKKIWWTWVVCVVVVVFFLEI